MQKSKRRFLLLLLVAIGLLCFFWRERNPSDESKQETSTPVSEDNGTYESYFQPVTEPPAQTTSVWTMVPPKEDPK